MYKELHQLDVEELDMLALLIEKDIPGMCTLLFPNHRPVDKTIIKQVGQWAINRKVVIENQVKCNPHVALVFEKVCYRIWQKLPSYAKSIQVEADAIVEMALKSPSPPCQTIR